MATAVARKAAPKPAVLDQRRRIAEERLALEIALAPQWAEAARIDAELKRVAGEIGDSFKEDFGEKGSVAVAPPKQREFKGDMPVIVPEVWANLKEAQRERLLNMGVIKLAPNYSNASNGRVTVKVL